MKTVSVRDMQKKIGECVDAAQHGRIVVTRHGKPALLLVGVEGKDWETLFWETNEQLWLDLVARREQKTITMAEMRRRLQRSGAARKPRRASVAKSSSPARRRTKQAAGR
jgi:prevent-host-death family protein